MVSVMADVRVRVRVMASVRDGAGVRMTEGPPA